MTGRAVKLAGVELNPGLWPSCHLAPWCSYTYHG